MAEEMSAVTTLRLPAKLLQRVRDEAAREHRTMAGEIAALLEEAFDCTGCGG